MGGLAVFDKLLLSR